MSMMSPLVAIFTYTSFGEASFCLNKSMHTNSLTKVSQRYLQFFHLYKVLFQNYNATNNTKFYWCYIESKH